MFLKEQQTLLLLLLLLDIVTVIKVGRFEWQTRRVEEKMKDLD
jgi:hypothetical protein